MPAELKIVKRADGHWITGDGLEDHGPYASRWDAQDDKEGLERHLKAAAKFYERLEKTG